MSEPRLFVVSAGEPLEPMMAEAAALIRAGRLVAFPTETVYGLAADAANPAALDRLNRVKGRPPEKPYSWHVHDAAQVQALVGRVSPMAQRLMDRFWPGPLTIVIPGADGKTIGFRLPQHPVAQAFLRACGRPVVAPSANRSGFPPPTDAKEVLAALDGDCDGLIDNGPTPLGRESTVVQVLGDRLEILREGALSEEQLRAALHAA